MIVILILFVIAVSSLYVCLSKNVRNVMNLAVLSNDLDLHYFIHNAIILHMTFHMYVRSLTFLVIEQEITAARGGSLLLHGLTEYGRRLHA